VTWYSIGWRGWHSYAMCNATTLAVPLSC